MLSWQALAPLFLKPAGAVTNALRDIGKTDLRAAAEFVCKLPYGRNSNPDDPLIVIGERRGTCSTKHALLGRLAIEQEFDVALILGIYQMNGSNTPGVQPVLQRHGLSSLPEAHCYLLAAGERVDITKASSGGHMEPINCFLHEEEITPAQITHYKRLVHRRFIADWIAANDRSDSLSLDDVSAIREECIMSLEARTVIGGMNQ